MRDETNGGARPLMARRPGAAPRARRSGLAVVALLAVVVVGVMGGLRYGLPVEASPYAVTAGAFAVEVKGPGLLEAQRHAVLGATVQGRIAALPVDVGDHVAEGAPVARLEAAEAEIDLAHAREQARALGHQIIEAEAQKRREEATLRRFERELQRQLELRARGVIADGALDIARAERDAAEARVAEAAARIERLGADLSGAQRLVDRRREALAQTVVTAPFDGIIVSREREIGDVVTAGTPILEIVDPGTLVLSTRLDESQMAQMAHGQPAVVFFESEPVRSHAATVTRISREVDPETREFALKLALETLPRNWAIGQRGSAAITIAEREDVLALPTALVGHRRGSAGAWVLENGRAHWREVELGGSSDGKVAVLAGLEDGDTALEGETLYRGMRVEVGR